jgi:hypothetical protein
MEGDPRMPGTLHYVNPDGVSLNQYQKALTAISSILMKYDSDKKIPVLGFGAKLQRGGVLNNCFQCGSTPEADGINGILEAYQSTLWSGITLSGPTFFKDIIQHAASRATQNHVRVFIVFFSFLILSPACPFSRCHSSFFSDNC